MKPTIAQLKENNDGKLPTYAWPGGYQIIYYSKDGTVFCPDCANQEDVEPEITEWDIFYEGPPEVCEGCGFSIFSAYGDPDEDQDDFISQMGGLIMSYGISLRINTGKGFHKVEEPRYTLSSNYTRILCNIFEVDSVHSLLDEKKAGDIAEVLQEGIMKIYAYPQTFNKSMINGVGSIDDLLEYLLDLKRMCEDHPDCILFVY